MVITLDQLTVQRTTELALCKDALQSCRELYKCQRKNGVTGNALDNTEEAICALKALEIDLVESLKPKQNEKTWPFDNTTLKLV